MNKKETQTVDIKTEKVNNSHGKGRVGRYALYYFCFFGMFLVIAVALSLTSFFKIEQVFVSGNNKYLESDIIRLADIKIGTNLFTLNEQEIKDKLIKEFVYIEDVKIKKQLPPSIILEIDQAEPFATLKTDNCYLLVSDKGVVLEQMDQPYSTSMPIVLGVASSSPIAPDVRSAVALDGPTPMMGDIETGTYAASMAGSKVTPSNTESLSMLNALVKALESTVFGDVTAIDLSNILNIVIVYEDRLIIELGSEHDLEYKLNFIKQTAEYKQENFEGVIDVTIPKQLRVRKADISSLIETDYNITQVEVDNFIPLKTEKNTSQPQGATISPQESSTVSQSNTMPQSSTVSQDTSSSQDSTNTSVSSQPKESLNSSKNDIIEATPMT